MYCHITRNVVVISANVGDTCDYCVGARIYYDCKNGTWDMVSAVFNRSIFQKMSGRLKSQVDLELIAEHHRKSENYDETARWAAKKWSLPILGAHVRYWLTAESIASKAKILLFDIETAPMEVYTWGLYNQDIGIGQIKKDWYVLMWAAKWYGSGVTHFNALNQHPSYAGGSDCEEEVVRSLWHLLNEADIVVAQNGKAFDVRKMNAKFLEFGMKPPSPYKIVDTYKIAKANFGFSSHKLDYMGKLLGFGGKNKTDFDLWLGCMSGDKKAWKTMIDYCVKDVDLLEEVYTQIRSWDKYHPIVHVKNTICCHLCGSEQLTYIGDYNTTVSTFMTYECKDCAHQQRSRVNVLTDKHKQLRMVNV